MTIPVGQSKLLAVCIPTRNRPEMLAECLSRLVERLRPWSIPIYLSDNSTNSNTVVIAKEIQAEYPFLHHSRCENDLDADHNFVRALGLPDTKYRWLFGDHYKIDDKFDLSILFTLLEAGHELIALNSRNRIRGIESGSYSDAVFVFEKMSWHLTMMTSLIYSDRLLERMCFERYYGTFLCQTLSIFEEFSRRKLDFYWLADIAITSYPIDPFESWQHRALTVFVKDWFNGIMSLPPRYSFASKQVALMSHASNVGLFSFRGMVYLRALGAVDWVKVKDVRKEVPFVLRIDRRLALYFALLTPRFITSLALKIYMRRRGFNRGPG